MVPSEVVMRWMPSRAERLEGLCLPACAYYSTSFLACWLLLVALLEVMGTGYTVRLGCKSTVL